MDAYMRSVKAIEVDIGAYMRSVKVISMDAYMRFSIFSIS